MKTVGLITEYNPFHNGHLYHIQKSKEITKADYVVVIMSGNFVQRGEPAIINKWVRTKMALDAGADLVIELPVMYATASAEFFAFGAIQLLHQMGIVDCVCFGSEKGDLQLLLQISNILSCEPPRFKTLLKNQMDEGLAFPIARSRALQKFISENKEHQIDIQDLDTLLSSPNNILGIEYLKALQKLNSTIIPYTITRKQAHYHSEHITGNIASATAIRKVILSNNLDQLYHIMPKKSVELLVESLEIGNGPVLFDDFSSILQYLLRTLSPRDLRQFMEIEEGMENRILRASATHFLITELSSAVKTKRYTFTRIQRALLHILLQIKTDTFWKFHLNGGPQYIRILGFRKQSQPLLARLKKESSLPVISNVKSAFRSLENLSKEMLQQEISTTDIYYLCVPKPNQRVTGKEFTSPLVITK
jgi:predicted nucleotidyltransferase